MPIKTQNDVIESVKKGIAAASPQVRVDADNGPFYYLAAKAVAAPLADISAQTERMAQLSTLQFPLAASGPEMSAVARSFGVSLGGGGFAQGVAYVCTGRRPQGTQVLTVSAGDSFGTAVSGGLSFVAIETRSLTAGNADAYFNRANRRYELPVRVQAVSAGTSGNIPPGSLSIIQGGATGFDTVTNVLSFEGGRAAQSRDAAYARVQQRLAGLDTFSRGGLVSTILGIDTSRIQSVALTYSSEYPALFHRLPDGNAVDAWVLNAANPFLVTESFVAAPGQTEFPLSYAPVLSLSTVQVNGETASASLSLDESLEYGRSSKEVSKVYLETPASQGDVVEISYSYDSVIQTIQQTIDGQLNSSSGALFATDVLVRYPKSLAVSAKIRGKVLGTFDPSSVEDEVLSVVGSYLVNGLGDAPLLGGMRTAAELRDVIRSQVPGISTLSIPVFGRKSLGQIVETITIPRNARLTIEDGNDLTADFS